MLEQDIRVSASHLDLEALRERLSVSDGVRKPSRGLDAGSDYEDAALVPDSGWRELTDEEFTSLTAPAASDPRYFANVQLAKLSDELTERLGWLADEQVGRIAESSLRTAPRDIRIMALDALASQELVTAIGPVLSVGWSRSEPGLITVTPNSDGRRVGLHVDSWDVGSTFRTRREGSNRLAINAGADKRYLLFVPIQVASMVAAIERDSQMDAYVDVAREYLVRAQLPSIYRLEVAPRECYVAPTENMIHDGSTVGATAPDTVLFVRGYIHVSRSA